MLHDAVVRKQWGHTFDKKTIKGNDFACITMKTKNQNTEKWVKTWQRAGSALDRIRHRALAEFDYEKNRKVASTGA